jgi:diguanylate cyclase (GGDEF)-like protein
MHLPPPIPADESARIETLRRYCILDTGPEERFDRIVEIAKRRFKVPIALVAFMDSERNFFKATGGLAVSESPRSLSFCGYTILGDEALVINDARRDPRFAENPLVAGELNLCFYAGAPLIVSNGQRIGTLCLLDTKPRQFTEDNVHDLQDMASIVTDLLEMRLAMGNVLEEVERRRTAEARARDLAYRDVLTGLPNRAYRQHVLVDGLSPLSGTPVAALSADIDHFKEVNDTLGHYAGDQVLQRIAELLRGTIGDHGFVARVSGDEFVALFDASSSARIRSIASAVTNACALPCSVGGHTITTSLSLGLAFNDTRGTDIEGLIRDADLALRVAKRNGRNQVAVYDEKIANEARRRTRLGRDLDLAIRNGSIEVKYQPIHQAPNGPMIGVEALARWRHPSLGNISPLEFIELAEESGRILELSGQILLAALKASLHWNDITVAVNLSPVQFKLTDLAHDVDSMLRQLNYPSHRLSLEVTESVLLNDFENAKRQIEQLHRIGVKVALDDFGTGFSSLNYLVGLSFDKLKIDQGFVRGIGQDPKHDAIVRHIIALARELDMRVTAEGVETEEQSSLLAAAGCTSLQGYFFSAALSSTEIDQRLRNSIAA